MLRKIKPLAYFSEISGREPDCLVRYLRLFDKNVAAGRFIKREIIETYSQQAQLRIRRRFYALPDHEWRIDSMLTLLNRPGVWSIERERQFGELLGYEDWQNDYWLGLGTFPAEP